MLNNKSNTAAVSSPAAMIIKEIKTAIAECRHMEHELRFDPMYRLGEVSKRNHLETQLDKVMAMETIVENTKMVQGGGHFASLIGERPSGSKWGREFSEEDFFLDWTDSTEELDAAVRIPGCRYFKLASYQMKKAFPDATVDAVEISKLSNVLGHIQVAESTHKSGRTEVSLIIDSAYVDSQVATEAWLIIGDEGGKDVIFTAHPGRVMGSLSQEKKDVLVKLYRWSARHMDMIENIHKFSGNQAVKCFGKYNMNLNPSDAEYNALSDEEQAALFDVLNDLNYDSQQVQSFVEHLAEEAIDERMGMTVVPRSDNDVAESYELSVHHILGADSTMDLPF